MTENQTNKTIHVCCECGGQIRPGQEVWLTTSGLSTEHLADKRLRKPRHLTCYEDRIRRETRDASYERTKLHSRTIIGIFAILLLLGCVAQPAQARPPYLEAFETYYGLKAPQETWQQRLASTVRTTRCNVCHVPGRPREFRNPYGEALEARVPAYDEAAWRNPARAKGLFLEVYKAMLDAGAEKDAAGNLFHDKLQSGTLP